MIGMMEHWNVGILGFGLRLVEPTARRGDWEVGTLEEFIVDIRGKVLNSKDDGIVKSQKSSHSREGGNP
jgi:hypothetical protein